MGGIAHLEGAEPPVPSRREPGETVALREIWDGRIWYARPATVVRDDPNLQMFHVPPRARCKQPVDAFGNPLRMPVASWTLEDEERSETRVLSFAFPDTPYAVILPFDPAGHLQRYYVNLQTPLVPSPAGYDTVEHLLDVTIAPDRSAWSWKDEDEVEQAIAYGLFTPEQASWFRYWGERAVEHVLLREPPFDRDWDDWTPDPAWEEPTLPETWDLAPV